MKKSLTYTVALFVIVSFLASCASYSNGRGNRGLPPGQAKKIHGTKSAKPFAPGQQKKKNKRHKNQGNKFQVNSNYYLSIWEY